MFVSSKSMYRTRHRVFVQCVFPLIVHAYTRLYLDFLLTSLATSFVKSVINFKA